MSKTLLLIPRVSEKAYDQSQKINTYVFDVPKDVNKHSVARAVTAQYEVTVTNVNTTIVKGKAIRSIRKGGKTSNGRQTDTKKAYVTLKEGDSLPIFAKEDKADKKKTPKVSKGKK